MIETIEIGPPAEQGDFDIQVETKPVSALELTPIPDGATAETQSATSANLLNRK